MSFNQTNMAESVVLSIEANNLDKFKQFLSSGYSVNSFLHTRNRFWDTNCFTILAIAAFSGAKNIVEFLIAKNAQINQMDLMNSRTALHWAVASRNYEIAKMLIEAGAYVNALDRDSVSPLILAATSGELCIVQMLIRKGAVVTQCDRMRTSALHYACMRLHVSIARELIAHGCVINTNTPFNYCSPLKYLIDGKHYGIARMLIEAGCNLKNEKWLLDESATAHIMETDAGKHFLAWLRAYITNPVSLRSLARLAIRSRLGGRMLESKISLLNLPRHLNEFLLMKF